VAYAVPDVAGVPALLGGFLPLPLPPQLFADVIGLVGQGLAPQWGIFLGGSPVVVSDNVISMDCRQDWVIADFPLEGGKFETYDKVQRPFDVRFRFSAGGSAANRSAMIQSIKQAAASFDLYMFVAPDDTWENVNISHIDWHRTAQQGLGLVVADVWGWQVQLNTSSQLSNVEQAASADPSVRVPNASATGADARTQVYDAPAAQVGLTAEEATSLGIP
jgi:hypothetical protein